MEGNRQMAAQKSAVENESIDCSRLSGVYKIDFGAKIVGSTVPPQPLLPRTPGRSPCVPATEDILFRKKENFIV